MSSKIALKNLQDQEFSINHLDGAGAIAINSNDIVTKTATSVTDNAIARYDGTTGKVQNSTIIIDDNNNIGIGGTPSAKGAHIIKNDTTAYNNAATDGQISVGSTLLLEQTAGSNVALSQIVFQPRSSFGYNRIVSSGGSAPYMDFITNNVKRVSILTSGELVSDFGVKLPNSAISDVNTLDYYQEGTFTPVIEGITTAGVGTYTAQLGRYTRIGNRVDINLAVALTAHTGTGSMRLSGLPFSVSSDLSCSSPIGSLASLSFTSGNIPVFIGNSGANYFDFWQIVPNGAIIRIPIDTAFSINTTLTYFV